MPNLSKLILFIFILNSSFIILNSSALAQSPSPSPSGGTLPQSGVETPLLLIGGGGLSLLSSGFLLRKLQKQ